MMIDTTIHNVGNILTQGFSKKVLSTKYEDLIINVSVEYGDIVFHPHFDSWDTLDDVVFCLDIETNPYNQKYVHSIRCNAFEFYRLLIELRKQRKKKNFKMLVNLESHEVDVLKEFYNLIQLEFSLDEEIHIQECQ